MIFTREITLAWSILILAGTGTSWSTPSTPQADAEIRFERLDVNIGGPLLQRLAHDLINEAYDRGFDVVVIDDVDLLLELEGLHVDLAPFQDGVEGLGADAVAGAERGEDAATGRDAPGDRFRRKMLATFCRARRSNGSQVSR